MHPDFANGNLVSGGRGRLSHFAADLVVCLRTMRVLKDRYEAPTRQSWRVMKRLHDAIKNNERVLVLT